MFFKKVLATITIAVAAAVSLTSCSSAPDLNPSNVMLGDWDIAYLKVNDKSVVCYTPESDSAAACEWSNVNIPNGVEVIELNNDSPESGEWELSYIVTINNETVPCVSQYSDFGSCDFKSNSSDGGYGESQSNVKSETTETSTAPSASPSL